MRRLSRRGEMNVTDLALALRASQPLVSWHLGVLRRAGFVRARRDGRVAWYSAEDGALGGLMQQLGTWLGNATREPGEEEGYG